MPSMQYRRPSDTFVQWFDSAHILYGLNLTSVAEAEGFEREFEIATGKRQRSGTAKLGQLKNSASGLGSNASNNSASGSAAATGASVPSSNHGLQANSNKRNVGEGIHASASQVSMSNAASDSKSLRSNSNDVLASSGNVGGGNTPDAARNVVSDKTAASDARQINTLKSRVKELELQNLTLDGDRNMLNETIASQAKTISGLQNQIKQLETDIDKLKTAFQQNASNVNIWKQQLQTYQQVNDQLTTRLSELTDLYDKFGDILKRGD
eukprot:Partr_v1_DN27131_c0_g1_i4_m15454